MEGTKRCPRCAEEILAAANKCKHCGSEITLGDYRLSATQAESVQEPLKITSYGGVALAVLAILALAAYGLSPFYAFYTLKEAAKAADRDQIDEVVDFSAVRDSLKSQVSAIIIHAVQQDRELRDNPFAAAGALLAPAITDRLIESLVTPDGIAMILNQGRLSGNTPGTASTRQTAEMHASFAYRGLDRFRVELNGPSMTDGPVGLILERRGFVRWKLIRVDLPSDAFRQKTQKTTSDVGSRKRPIAGMKPRGAQFSDWGFSTYTTEKGTFFCSIFSGVKNQDIGQNLVIKGSPGANNLIIDLYKDEWNWAQGSTVNLKFDFLDNEPLTLAAYGDAHILDVQLPTDVTAPFLLELVQRQAVRVSFATGGEAPWYLRSTGAKLAVEQLASCLKGK